MALRLRFSLPEFLRIVWATPAARDVWEHRIGRASNAWHLLERLAVVKGLKPATLQTCSPDNLAGLASWAMENKLVLLPLAMQGMNPQGYTTSTQSVVAGKPWEYRVVIAQPHIAPLFAEYWREQNNDLIGAALGFPNCCREFFQWAWVEQGWKDTTLPMSVNHDLTEKERAKLVDTFSYVLPSNRVGGPVECNILLRWLGIRFVSHLPCSFYCEHTKTIGEKMRVLAIESGLGEEIGWTQEMLQWPMQWSSLHGVATITTPAFRIVTDSTPLKSKVIVERDGPRYPDEGARGNQFPFKNYHRLTIHRGDDHTDNGFKSRAAMNEAHSLILMAVETAISHPQRGGVAKVIDLGCGNGALLEKIVGQASWLVPCGVEKDSGKHQRAARRLIGYDPDLYLGDLYDDHYWNPPYSIALLSVNRLYEADEHDARSLMSRLRDGCDFLILYSYDDSDFNASSYMPDCFKLLSSFSNPRGAAHLLESRVRGNATNPV